MAFFARPQPTQVRISTPDDSSQPSTPRKDSVQRQCRNIVIYGHCKYQDKGCHYQHPQDDKKDKESPALAVTAPIFVPKNAEPIQPTSPDQHVFLDPYDPFQYPHDDSVGVDDLGSNYFDYTPYDPNGLDSFYTNPPLFMRQPLNYLLYTPAMPDDFVPSNANTHFVPPSSTLRQSLQIQSETIRGVAPPGQGLPEELQGYHTFVPLEQTAAGIERRKFGSWYSTVYRAIRTSDGRPYALRRIENYRLMHQSAFAAIEMWSSISHPNIVPVREAFTTKAFNDNSLVVVYGYYPNAQTLFDLHFKGKPSQTSVAPSTPQKQSQSQSQQPQLQPHTGIPERTIWSYVVQLASAIRKVHEMGHPVRMIDPTKIIVTSQNRLRIGSCGVIDVLMHGTPVDLIMLQQEDLTMFGRLVFSLACNNVAAWTAPMFQKSLDHMVRCYSQDLKSVALYLISKPTPHKSIEHLCEMIRPRIQAEMEEALVATDRLENELLSELENARLVRLLCKFGFINERPEFAREPRWSETGDRYIIKLFRDYVFHQVDEQGNPVVNMSHILTCLNKLDAGTEERIMLIARDEQSCLVVTYKEIKACIEGAFSDLARPTNTGIVQFQPPR